MKGEKEKSKEIVVEKVVTCFHCGGSDLFNPIHKTYKKGKPLCIQKD